LLGIDVRVSAVFYGIGWVEVSDYLLAIVWKNLLGGAGKI
jgi:hypothetical protein